MYHSSVITIAHLWVVFRNNFIGLPSNILQDLNSIGTEKLKTMAKDISMLIDDIHKQIGLDSDFEVAVNALSEIHLSLSCPTSNSGNPLFTTNDALVVFILELQGSALEAQRYSSQGDQIFNEIYDAIMAIGYGDYPDYLSCMMKSELVKSKSVLTKQSQFSTLNTNKMLLA